MKYAIAQLEKLSGVKAHTIRMWEQRYNALQPMRSPGNTRYYDDEQLRKLLNIAKLVQSGKKVSEVCALSAEAFDALLRKEEIQHTEDPSTYDQYVTQLIGDGLAYNEIKFDQTLSSYIQKEGIVTTYKNIIYPLLVRLGLMWSRDDISPGQEHFISNIIKRKLYHAIDDLPIPKKGDKQWLLFLPEDEDHDIGLLFSHFLLQSAGNSVIYLGSKVPFESLQEVISDTNPTHLLLFMIKNKPTNDAQAYLEQVVKLAPKTTLHIAGNKKLIGQLTLPTHAKWFQSLNDFEKSILP